MKKKVLLVVTSHSDLGNTGRKTGYYLPEVSHPYFRLAEAGFEVDFASPKGGKAPLDENSRDLTDPDNRRFLADPKLVAKLENTWSPNQVKASDYDAILYAGGHGTMWDFPGDTRFANICSSIYESGGVVAAVCHGPAALVNVKLSDGNFLVDGKTISAFTDAEEAAAGLTDVMPFLLESKLIERGARIRKAALWQKAVSVDDRLVTGQNPASAAGVGEAVVSLLGLKVAKAEKTAT